MDKERVLEWLKYADMDLEAVLHLLTMSRKLNEIICYHCQQSTEKYLKGYLISKEIQAIPKTHDLIQLCELCRDYDPRFDDISDKCGYLSDYSIQSRYPEGLEVDDYNRELAVSYAMAIKNFTPFIELRESLSPVDKNLIDYLEDLSCLTLSDDEKQQLSGDFKKILDYMDRLNELDTSGVPERSHPFDHVNAFRDDEAGASLERELILQNAPDRNDEMYIAPKTVE